ncbi:MAG: very short patch repair endonuclease [Acidobacteriota bacterium]
MADVLTAEERSACMRAVRGQDTKPEMVVRRMLHGMGYRYRLHTKHLPGKPDLVFPSRHKVIFVHGCFWHMHQCRRGKRIPVSNFQYWNQKRNRNADRDRKHIKALRRAGWKILVIWECRIKDVNRLRARLTEFL